MKRVVRKKQERVRDLIEEVRVGLPPEEDKELLEELSTDIAGFIDCLKEENPDL